MGQALVETLAPIREVRGLNHAELDILDLAACRRIVADVKPRTVINCAAYTKVDLAETEEDLATRINAQGAGHLALASAEVEAKIVYFSTDFVFDGRGNSPYPEDAPPNPLSAYGRSKLKGERATASVNPDHLILRTAWLYGPHGPNFVRTILKAGRETGQLRVVNDQVGSPTFTLDLAQAVKKILDLDLRGIYNLVNLGEASWYDLAEAAVGLIGLKVDLKPLATAELNRPAPRPAYSVLDARRLQGLGIELRPWPEALAEYLRDFEV